ncbi:hypothetical protein PsorP6_006736 [Peronosclerospora sorghi]|uniref:Uncharacterized protein n=1 Tax=Peronosclerospora sorghi TaxID=230839 RepID=A0ACC0W2L4_9STRA|nr:hypothetical protein PsorP6_006736 [Peronosclerospora sorghi]
MHSPLAVSQISLSQSSDSSAFSSHAQPPPPPRPPPRPKKKHRIMQSSSNGPTLFDVESPAASSSSPADKTFLYQKQLTPNAVPLLVRLQRRRIVCTAVVGTVALVLVMMVLEQGIVLTSYDVVANSDDPRPRRRSDTVETYNTFVGLATSFVVQPLLQLVAAVVPAVLLCFLTRLTMQEKSSRWTRYALACVGNLVLVLLLNGFLALHVRDETVRVEAVMRDSDLFVNDSASRLPDDHASSLDTILRTVIQVPDPSAEMPATQCRLPSPRRLPAQLEFAFPSRPWLRDFLPLAPATTRTNTLSLSLGDATDSIEDAQLPMPVTSARNLVHYAMRATDDFFREQDVPANASAFQVLDGPKRNASADATSVLQALVEATSAAMNAAVRTRAHLKNLSIPESRVEFVTLPWQTDSGRLVFEGVTLEMPLKRDFLRRDVNFINDTTHSVVYGAQHAPHALFEINAKEECGRSGCVVSPVGAALTTAPADTGSQVRALPICLDDQDQEDYKATMNVAGTACKHRSTTSMLVLSFAKRIVGDVMRSSLERTSSGEAAVVTLTNARKIYEITAGRLSWETSDLASKYDASCAASNACHGLAFPLSSEQEQALLVGTTHIPVHTLRAYTPSLLHWTPLVTSNTQEVDTGDILKSDFIFPKNFRDTRGWSPIDASRCERERGMFLDRVETWHMYSERSLRPAYQSALLWVFQSGVVKQKLDSKLPLDARESHVDVTLVVPRVSALLTYVGAGLLLVMGLVVFFGGKRREAQVERHFKPHHLARILLDDEAFSHKLLKCDLLNIGNEFLNSSELLDQFEISGLALRHRTCPSDMIIVPKCEPSPRPSPV